MSPSRREDTSHVDDGAGDDSDKVDDGGSGNSSVGSGRRLNFTTGEAGVLAEISNAIDDHLWLFRAGAATVTAGSGLTLAFFVYRRGLHGFSSAAQVPASYFERRQRVRVRVSRVFAAATENTRTSGLSPALSSTAAATTRGASAQMYPRTASPSPSSSSSASVSLAHEQSDQSGTWRRNAFASADRDNRFVDPVSDVILYAEHITLARRILRLPPRSLFPGDAGKAWLSPPDTFVLRMYGVAATEEGVKRVREELAAPLTARYCDAELLFREPRRLGSGSTAYGLTDGGSGQMTVTPVAVCHVHRRRDRSSWLRSVLLWWSKLDPRRGFGEKLLEEGQGYRRQERWCTENTSDEVFMSTESVSDDLDEPLPALKRLGEDSKHLRNAELKAKADRRGLWASSGRADGRGDHEDGRAVHGGWDRGQGLGSLVGFGGRLLKDLLGKRTVNK